MKSKTDTLLDEASYYTGDRSGSSAPETASPYEFSKDSVPTLNKIGDLEDQGTKYSVPQELPHPLQGTVQDLADLYLKAENIRNNFSNAKHLPAFKGKEEDLAQYRKKLNEMMVLCKKMAAKLTTFSLAPDE